MTAPRAPTKAEAFRYWLRLGFISFGRSRRPDRGSPDAAALGLFAAATFALFRVKAGVIPAIAACGAAGLVLAFL